MQTNLSIGDYAGGFVVVAVLGLLSVQYLFGFYQDVPNRLSRVGRKWAGKWDFLLQDIGGFSSSGLMLVSILGLFLELLIIRWVSSEIRIFSYFKNFVLIACFLGFGLGGYFCRRRINLLAMTYPILFIAALVTLPWKVLIDTMTSLPELIGPLTDVQFSALRAMPLSFATVMAMGAATVIIIPLFALIALAFIPIGQMVGWYLENAPKGIRAYTVNIVGSLLGILAYTLLCFYFQPPAIWFLVAGALAVLVFRKSSRLKWSAAAVFACCAALSLIPTPDGSKVYWSPYQKLSISPEVEGGEVMSYRLNTNGTWFQQILNLSAAFVNSHAERFAGQSIEWNAYNLPYHFFSEPPSVLILGSGMGNDVAGALRNGAGRVVAVEIDPLVVRLGRELHFEHPYQSQRVNTIVDDARSYLQNSHDRFDLIVFSLLDSHTTSSHFSNIRIDNYVYTKEAFESAKKLLAPGGLMIVKFWVPQPWIAGRLRALMEDVFGRPPLQIQTQSASQIMGYSAGGYFLIAGSDDRISAALRNPDLAEYVQKHSRYDAQSASITTDDWPYFYQRQRGLPVSVIAISVVLILMCWWFLRTTNMSLTRIRWPFFFLGAGFMLLEAQIVSKMALLFGTTWVVNSIVISGLMILIVLANYVVDRKPQFPYWFAYLGVFCSMLINYLVPLETFFFRSLALKVFAATVVLCLPVFFAGIIFIRIFAESRFSGSALGANLFGAMVGGMLESGSYWFGIKALLILAGLFYVFSAFTLGMKKDASFERAEHLETVRT
jgi:spermidine synthase